MSIQSRWKQEYYFLKEYIAANSGIHINQNEISIPQPLRDTFYRHFDAIRNTIADEYFTALPGEIDILCKNYLLAEKETLENLEIEQIQQPADLFDFLRNPKKGLVRSLYNRLFELMQGKISENNFEEMAENDINASIWSLYRLGYESWAALTLINLLEPDEAYSLTYDKNEKLVVSGLNDIIFGRQIYHPSKRLPEFIIHSKKLEKYIAFKMPLAREVDTFNFPVGSQDKPRDRTGDTSFVMDYRVLFLSIIEDLNNIPVYADIHSHKIVNNPDITIEFLTDQDMSDCDGFNRVKNRIAIMNPKFIGFIIVINPSPGTNLTNSRNMEIIPAGLDRLMFNEVIMKLT